MYQIKRKPEKKGGEKIYEAYNETINDDTKLNSEHGRLSEFADLTPRGNYSAVNAQPPLALTSQQGKN